MKKTAMQELISEIYKRPTEISQFNAVMLLELIEPYLEKEKEQIIESFDNGIYVGTYAVDKDGEEYYNQTYNQNN
jgi:uncharacterized protein (DUF2164 family)